MRYRQLRRASSKAEAWNSSTRNSIWKTLLVFTGVAFLNLVYVTQNFLVPLNKNQRDDSYFSSFVSVRNAIGGVPFDKAAPTKGGNPEDGETRGTTMIEKTVERQRQSEQNYGGNRAGNSGDEKVQSHYFSFETNRTENANEHKSKDGHAEIDSGNIGGKNQQGNNLGDYKTATKSTEQRQNGAGNIITEEQESESANKIKFMPRYKGTERQKKKRREHKKNKPKEEKNDSNFTLSPEDVIKYSAAPMPNISNNIYYRAIPPEYLVEDPSVYLWDRADAMIPDWMKDYFRWHRWKRSTWEDKNVTANGDWWESERWLISQCLMEQDRKKCGGTADRLKPILALLRIAYENKRIYLIRWTRPAPLEEFLLPPAGGFDWRVPPELAAVMEDEGNGRKFRTRIPILQYADGGLALMRARYQTHEPDRVYDNMVFKATLSENEIANSTDDKNENDKGIFGFDTVFSRVWKVMFTPSLPIQDILRSRLATLDLVPNEYVSSHLRALYAIDMRPTIQIQQFARNALACATEIFPGAPIFFASDSTVALEHARGFNGKAIDVRDGVDDGEPLELRVEVATSEVTPSNPPDSRKGERNTSAKAISEPWHLDSFVGPVENFYDTFVDLYLLAMAGCVTYGKGGFGHWGMLIGGHPHCAKRQFFIGKQSKNITAEFCTFRTTKTKAIHSDYPSVFGKDDSETGPLFLPPMN